MRKLCNLRNSFGSTPIAEQKSLYFSAAPVLFVSPESPEEIDCIDTGLRGTEMDMSKPQNTKVCSCVTQSIQRTGSFPMAICSSAPKALWGTSSKFWGQSEVLEDTSDKWPAAVFLPEVLKDISGKFQITSKPQAKI